MLFTKDKSFYRNIFTLAIPMMLQNLITFLVGFADNLMVGDLHDTAVSAVYMGSQLQIALQVLSVGIEGAILLLSAQYWGKRDITSIQKIASVGLLFAFLWGGGMTLVCALFPRQILNILTDEQAVAECGAEYLSVLAFSFLFFTLTQALIAVERSVEHTEIGMIVSSVSLVCNVTLNYLLIFGKCGFPELKVKGAAIATLISRIVEFLVILYYVRFRDNVLKYRFHCLWHIDKGLLSDFVRYGLPIIAGQLVWGCNLIAQSMILGRFDEPVMTATSLANTVNNMMYVTMNGLSGAVGVFIGKQIGAGKTEKIREYSVTVQVMFLLLGLLTSGVFLLLRTPYIALYDISENARMYSSQFIGILCVTCIGTCYECACLFGLVKSGGDVGFVFKNDTIFVFLVVIPSALIALFSGCQPWVVYLCLKSDQILKCIVAFFKIRKYDWMKNLTKETDSTETKTIQAEES